MKLHMHTGGLAATNAYLILDEATHQGTLVDAPRDTIAPLLTAAREQGYDLPLLLLTHAHWDHVGDHAVYTAAFPHGKILAHADALPMLQAPNSSLWDLPYTIAPCPPAAFIQDDQSIAVGTLKLQALHTPGHAPGHVAFYCADQQLLLAGDLLFAGAVGRWDLPESNVADLQNSLRRVMALPDATRVLSGHGPATTIGAERKTNALLRQLGVL